MNNEAKRVRAAQREKEVRHLSNSSGMFGTQQVTDLGVLGSVSGISAATARELRERCLQMAVETGLHHEFIVTRASAFYDFITGTDRAALAEEAKAAIDRAVG